MFYIPEENEANNSENALEIVPDVENNEPTKKMPYPKRVFFIIGNEFCERFNYYGMRSEIFFQLFQRELIRLVPNFNLFYL